MEETLNRGASRDSLSPRNLKEPGLRETAGRAAWTRITGQMHASYNAAFSSHFETKMLIEEHDVRNIIVGVEQPVGACIKCIRVRELAATHRLGRMRSLRMLEE